MKTKMKMVPKAKPSVKIQTTLLYAAGSIAFVGLVVWGVFMYLNFGNTEEAYAAGNFASNRTGNWSTGSTWNGSTAPGVSNISDNITINANHTVTLSGDIDFANNANLTVNGNGKLVITGNFNAGNNFNLMVNGELVISGTMRTGNNANITVNGSGKLSTSGTMTFGNNVNFGVDGKVTGGNNISFGNNSNFRGNGQVSIVGNDCSTWNGPGSCQDNIALPVKLLSFAAEAGVSGVDVTWKTAAEINNDFFTLERSPDGVSYETLVTITGHGTTKSVSSYSYMDTNPLPGDSYYRLSQTDYDGTTEVFKPVLVKGLQKAENSMSIFPNPLRGTTLTVSFNEPEPGSIDILDSRGHIIMSETVDGLSSELQFSIGDQLQPGLYYVNFRNGGNVMTQKLIKQQ